MGPNQTKVIEIYSINLTLLALVLKKSTNKISLKYEDIIMRTVDLSPLYRSFIGQLIQTSLRGLKFQLI